MLANARWNIALVKTASRCGIAVLTPVAGRDYSDDLWTVYQRVQEEPDERWIVGRTRSGKSSPHRAVTGIDGDVSSIAPVGNGENMLGFSGVKQQFRHKGDSLMNTQNQPVR